MADNQTNIAIQLSRIQSAKNTIRNKLIEMGLVDTVANLTTCAGAVSSIEDRGAVSATVQEGDTYTIPRGYHNGSGTVSGVAGGGNYNLQSKIVTPTKSQQNVTPDAGYYGMSDVTVGAIPAAYQDVSSVNVVASEVLTGKIYVAVDGTVVTGTMANNGAVVRVLTPSVTRFDIPEGYHDGKGYVSINVEKKTVTPALTEQLIQPDTGNVMSEVLVAAIPEKYVDTTDANAVAGQILNGKTAYVNGVKVTGNMPDNGSVESTINGLTNTSVTVPAGYTTGGVIALTSDIEEALAAI